MLDTHNSDLVMYRQRLLILLRRYKEKRSTKEDATNFDAEKKKREQVYDF